MAAPAPAPAFAAPDVQPGRPVSMPQAMALARNAVALFTELTVDAVVSCGRAESGWRVVVDVVESPARMGDNDLLATYEVTMAADGEVEGFARTGRYHRADAARG